MIVLRILRRPDGVLSGPDVHAIPAAGATIGRAPDCDIVLDDPMRLVSRQHAWIMPDGVEQAIVGCLSTISPLYVNDTALSTNQQCAVHDGDRMRIGGFEVLLETRVLPLRDLATTVVFSHPAQPAPPPVPLPPAPPVAPPTRAPVQEPPRPTVAQPARLDQWFDLETVPDPLGPASPLPALDTAARRVLLPGQSTQATAPSGADMSAPGPRTAQLARPPALTATVGLPARGTAPAPVPTTASADNLAALRQAFLDGAGLDSSTPLQLDADTLALLGALLRASTEGTLALLQDRAMAKRHLRAHGTGISARENNPLKFMPNATAALRDLLSREPRTGFLDPPQAVRAAHRDLQQHQVAMMAGMRAAMLDLMMRLGPEAIEAGADPAQGLARSSRTLRESQLWHRLQQIHAQLIANLDDSFDAAFGREFLRAYEEQSSAEPDNAPATRGPPTRVPPSR